MHGSGCRKQTCLSFYCKGEFMKQDMVTGSTADLRRDCNWEQEGHGPQSSRDGLSTAASGLRLGFILDHVCVTLRTSVKPGSDSAHLMGWLRTEMANGRCLEDRRH